MKEFGSQVTGGKMTDEQLIEEVATKVMGWKLTNYETGESIPEDWEDAQRNDGWMWDGRDGSYEAHEFNPLRNPSDCKMVREKLAERWDGVAMTMMTDRKTKQRIYAITVYNLDSSGRPRQLPETRADTEERAVVLCALKSLEAQ